MSDNEDWWEKCRTCQHCYVAISGDYVYCRKRNGKCEYKEYKPKAKKIKAESEVKPNE